MIICNYGNDFNYELEKLTRLFLPFERIDVINEDLPNERKAITVTEYRNDGCLISAEVFFDGEYSEKKTELKKCPDFIKMSELMLANCLFDCLVDVFDFKPSWGILTGVRPARLFLKTLEKLGDTKTESYFSDVLRVDSAKISLLSRTAASEQKIISLSSAMSFSLYISIPFCPTRCSYCSFVSNSVEKASDIIPQYLEKLFTELKTTAQIASKLKLKLETVYIGGGTPTTLTANQLDLLLEFVENHFDMSCVREFSVEAGRPDTISQEKLSVLKNHKVSRISINPQTLNDSVLSEIGRKHTASQFLESFDLARKNGFNNVNVDLIAGLPTDTFDGFKNTVDSVIRLSPESITVHSLAMKRSSKLTADGFKPLLDEGTLAAKMVNYAREKLLDNSILPYYMYRQSKSVGNLENVGYAKAGYEGLYNVFIMDETHTILACGASAATKLKNPFTSQITRIFNFKYPYEYINRFNEQILRKEQIYSFYGDMFKQE